MWRFTLKIGQGCGLQGKALLDFVESKEKAFKEEQSKQQELEREEGIRKERKGKKKG